AGKVIAEEGSDDDVLVGFVTALQHGVEAGAARGAGSGRQRREGEGRATLEIAGHQEAARRQCRKRVGVAAAGAEVSRKVAGQGLRGGIGRRGGGIGSFGGGQKDAGFRWSATPACTVQGLGGPFRVAQR